jgi:hypothetical protein
LNTFFPQPTQPPPGHKYSERMDAPNDGPPGNTSPAINPPGAKGTRETSSIPLLVTALGLAMLILGADLWSPRGITVSTLYVVPVILMQRATSNFLTCITAGFCAILATLGVILSRDIGVPASVVLANYIIALMALTLTTALGVVATRRSLHLKAVTSLLTMCAWTKQVKENGRWISIEEYLQTHSGVRVSHGISEDVAKKLLADIAASPRK